MRSSRLHGVLRPAWLVALPVALVILASSALAAQAAPPTSSVSDKIMCLCGCNSVLSVCPHPDCGWGIPAKEDIKQQLESGKTPDQVIAYYVDKYGEQVLASPTKKGFNMVVWVLPFVVLLAGAVVVYFLVKSWAVRRAAEELVEVEVTAPKASEDAQRRLEEELRKFD